MGCLAVVNMSKFTEKLYQNTGVVVWSVVIIVICLGIYNSWGVGRTIGVILGVYFVYIAIALGGFLAYEAAKAIGYKINIKGKVGTLIIACLLATIVIPTLLFLWTSCFGVLYNSSVCNF